MRPRSPSLRRRLVRRLLWPLFALFIASGLFTFWLSVHFANNVYDGWLYDSANSLALLVDRDGDHATCDLPVAAEEIFVWDESDSTFFTVRGDKSGVLASNASLPAVPPGADRYRDGYFFDTALNGHDVHVVALPLSAERAGENVWVLVGETDLKRKRLAQTILFAVLAPQLALIGAAFLAVHYGVERGLRPLRAIVEKLKFQRPTSLRALSDARVPEEVLPLTRAIDELLAGFDAVLSAQRKFVADAAHQLRTPLTAIKLNVERALGEEDGARARAILQQLRGSADRAARLANQLLSIARVESGAARPAGREDLDLLKLARESGAEWVPRAMARGIELSLREPQGEARVRGDALMIREALDNLLDNAIKYHPGGGHVRIELHAGATCQLIVEDDGPGIVPELWSKVFERFYRGDRTNAAGTGLGLPIVREIAAAHGGSVRLEAGEGGRGLRVILELPAAEARAAVPSI